MSISRAGVALLFAAASVYSFAWAIRGSAVAPSSRVDLRPHIYKVQAADREQLRRYFLEGTTDRRGRVSP
jgi:lipase chaperone LimK